MIVKGRIDLYYRDETLLRSRYYQSGSQRKTIIEMWQKQYKDRYSQTYLHILPYTDVERIDDNGVTFSPYSKKGYKQNAKYWRTYTPRKTSTKTFYDGNN